MDDQQFWQAIAEVIGEATASPFAVNPVELSVRSVAGGSINQSYRLSDGVRHFFVKLNRAERLAMLRAELAGLRALAVCPQLRLPLPITVGRLGGRAYLVMEWLDLTSQGDYLRLAQALVALHRITSDRFGWHGDNTIGSSPQANRWHQNWSDFWREERLLPQLRQLTGSALAQQGAQLLQRLPQLLAGHQPQPSLLHGDLWSGNVAFMAPASDGAAVIFDPACYYGDREADLAMSELFGGFPPQFYQAYQQAWPLAPGYQQRKRLYNLYHLLNHHLMFEEHGVSGGYGAQSLQVMRQLLAA
ncbi:MAG: fructosamine kinase family protein [Gammaproteobacteria bacterium]|nr:fructosamine kinase family protein [Gammaproteobacteria bacterium]